MTDLTVLSYAEAIERTDGCRRHLLLGNGFSIAARRQFDYAPLLKSVTDLSDATAAIFRDHDTSNFEVVMERLVRAGEIARTDGDDAALEAALDQIEELKLHLISTIAHIHPTSGFSVSVDESDSCRDFLKPFIGRNVIPHGIVFTTNYDLLLYWTVVKHLASHSSGTLAFDDGFFGSKWKPKDMGNVKVSVVYLHGSLHIFEDDNGVSRVVWSENGNIITQVRERLDAGRMPIFVSEGTPEAKSARIRRSAYLTEALNKFGFACKYKDAVLFTVGHSLVEQDDHIFRLVGSGTVKAVYLGAYGGLHSEDGELALRRAAQLKRARANHPKWPLEVFLFDSRECEIWSKRP